MNKPFNLKTTFTKYSLLLLMFAFVYACGGGTGNNNSNPPTTNIAKDSNTTAANNAAPDSAATAVTQKMAVRSSSDSTKVIELPDGTKVHLNRSSNIDYSESADGSERNVQLKGEAYFEVKKMNNKKFNVYAGNTKTTVVGTAFNVRAYENESDVTVDVVEGEVEFVEENDVANKTSIKAKEKAVYTKPKRSMRKAKSDGKGGDWWSKDQETILKNTGDKLKDAGEELKGLFKKKSN